MQKTSLREDIRASLASEQTLIAHARDRHNAYISRLWNDVFYHAAIIAAWLIIEFAAQQSVQGYAVLSVACCFVAAHASCLCASVSAMRRERLRYAKFADQRILSSMLTFARKRPIEPIDDA